MEKNNYENKPKQTVWTIHLKPEECPFRRMDDCKWYFYKKVKVNFDAECCIESCPIRRTK